MSDFIPIPEEVLSADKTEGLYVGEFQSPEALEGIFVQSEFL